MSLSYTLLFLSSSYPTYILSIPCIVSYSYLYGLWSMVHPSEAPHVNNNDVAFPGV